MKKKIYQKPILTSECFVPNEYIATCWTIACTQGKYGDDNMDHSGSCSIAQNNVISDNNGQITVRENSSDQGWLPCYLKNPSSWIQVQPGMQIEWWTYAANQDGRTWKHKGTVGAVNSARPLMS